MNYHNPAFKNDRANVMTMEQLDRVVEAILAGKYSWACLLILRSVGYNPMHYIPYRTYNRLMKEHIQGGNSKSNQATPQKLEESASYSKSRKLSESIQDLPYLESIDRSKVKVKGGFNSFSSYIFGVSPQDLDIR
ncbi:MAG: HetP family heterocyst commitment protein [Geitlerinemataceae cyanobacterium]